VGARVEGQDAGSGARAQWSMLLRGAALAFATLAVAAFAFAARADALIYWANANTHTIARANLDGTGDNQGFIKVVGGFPNAVAVDGTHIYWTVPDANTIGRANLDGTGTNQTFITGARGPEGVAVDGAHLYWTNGGSGTIGRANLDGSGVNQNFIAVASGSNGLAVDTDHLYWTIVGTQFTPDTIGRADLPDGTNVNQNFIPSLSGRSSLEGPPEGVAVDSTHVYWTELLHQSIGSANLDGTGAVDDFIGGPDNPTGIAVDAGHVYWSNFVSNAIGRADLPDGTNVDQSFIGAAGPEGIAVDASTTAPPPPPTIADLIAEVSGAGLPHGIERSLLAKLEGAQRKVDADHLNGACGSLGAYVNEVRAQTGKKLEAAYAEDLILEAIAVQDALGCGTS
jgi:virginiamycin B lyase